MIKIEIKIEGRAPKATYEAIWLDWSEFKIVPTLKNFTQRLPVTNGHVVHILKPAARKRYLAAHGYEDVEYASPEAA